MKKQITRSHLRKIIINEQIRLMEKELYQENMRYNARVTMLKKLKSTNIMLNEEESKGMFGGLMDMGTDYLKGMFGAGTETAKGFFVGKIASMFGVEEGTDTYKIIQEVAEEIEISELMGLISGKTKIKDIGEKVIKGIVEYFVQEGVKKMREKFQEIPLINRLLPDPETLFGNISTEKLSDDISKVVTPKIMTGLENATDTLKSAVSGEPDEKSLESLSEIYLGAAKHSRSNILYYNRKLKILRTNF